MNYRCLAERDSPRNRIYTPKRIEKSKREWKEVERWNTDSDNDAEAEGGECEVINRVEVSELSEISLPGLHFRWRSYFRAA
jgi:hypothetical protein